MINLATESITISTFGIGEVFQLSSAGRGMWATVLAECMCPCRSSPDGRRHQRHLEEVPGRDRRTATSTSPIP
jgi:hypothetical protein